MSLQQSLIKSYLFPIFLMISILFGSLVGSYFPSYSPYLKPLSDIFLNLIYTTMVPLIFFSVSSAIARAGEIGKVGNIIVHMTIVFIFTGIVAAVYAIILIHLFPPEVNITIPITQQTLNLNVSEQIVNIFTVSNFAKLLSHQNIFALIVFSILIGFATSNNKDAKIFLRFLEAGEAIFMRVFTLIMYYAPLGFFAYFAVLISKFGPELIQNYIHIAFVYYIGAILYFICTFSCYAYFAEGMVGIKKFWLNNFIPMLTAIATCSSTACIPINLKTSKAMGISATVYETTIPLGTIINKHGSIMGAIVKIAFLFSMFHLNFSGMSVLLLAVCVAMLVGTVMGAIPSGGMFGEVLILTIYGFPPSVLVAITTISIIIDPIATMLNVTGNNVSSMMIERLVHEKNTQCKKFNVHNNSN